MYIYNNYYSKSVCMDTFRKTINESCDRPIADDTILIIDYYYNINRIAIGVFFYLIILIINTTSKVL